MKTAPSTDLRDNLDPLLEWVQQGEEIRLMENGKAVARLVPFTNEEPAETPSPKY